MAQVTTPKANLVITNVGAPAEADLYSFITLAWTVQNQGSAATTSSFWSDSIFFSLDTSLGNDDWFLGSFDVSTSSRVNGKPIGDSDGLPLDPGESYTATLGLRLRDQLFGPIVSDPWLGGYFGGDGTIFASSVVITRPSDPVRELAGSGYLIFKINAEFSSRETESTEADSLFTVPFVIHGPDLTYAEAIAPNSAISGQQVNLSWTVKNSGRVATQSNTYWEDNVVFSRNQTYGDSDDVSVLWSFVGGSQAGMPLNPGETYAREWLGTLPAWLAGPGHLLFRTDANSTQTEWDETNNLSFLPINLEAANLAVTSVNSPDVAVAGQVIDLSWNVQNIGSVVAAKTDDFSDVVYFSFNTVFGDEDDIYLAHFVPPFGDIFPLAPGQNYRSKISIALPQNAAGSGYLLVRTNEGNHLAEVDFMDNVFVHPIQLQAPNLVLIEAVAPLQVQQGDSVVVSWTVTNGSDVSALASWTDSIFLSSDPYLDEEDALLANETIDGANSLQAGESYAISRSLRFPGSIVPGPRYVLFVANASAEQAETDASDNLRAVAITLTAPPIVGTLSAENDTISGVIEERDSPNPTREGRYSDDYILSDLVVGKLVKLDLSAAFDTFLQLINADTQQLIDGDDDSGQGTDSMLIFTPEADINYIVRVTSFGVNTTGSYSISATSRFPDLVVSSATVPASGVVGSSVSVSWTVSNQSATASAPIGREDAVYLSRDPFLDERDVFVGNEYSESPSRLGPGESYTESLLLTLPNQGLVGDVYLLFSTDDSNAEVETNEANNVLAVPFLVNAPDLAVTAATAPGTVSLGETISLSWRVENQGEFKANSFWYDNVVISEDQIFGNDDDVDLSQVPNFLPLDAKGAYEQTVSLVFPGHSYYHPDITGSRYLLFRADAYGNQGETNEQNNLFSLPINILAPDLQITAASAPLVAVAGETIDLTWTVNNSGPGLASRPWRDRVYLSTDQTINSGDVEVTTQWKDSQTPLAAGANTTISASAVLPAFGPGLHYLLFAVDDDGDQAESNELNNLYSLPIRLNAPDLIVSAAMASVRGSLGQSIDVSWTVVNQGSFPAPADWYDRVYLSEDDRFDLTDTFVAQEFISEQSPLAGGSSYSISRSVNLPSFFTGEAYLLFVTDAQTTEGLTYQGETEESNNAFAVPIFLEAPDLVVSDITLPSISYAGQTIDLAWTITNQGTSSAEGMWMDSIYMEDMNTGEVYSLGTIEYRGSLAVGQTLNRSYSYVIPDYFLGDYQAVVEANYANVLIEGSNIFNNIASDDRVITIGPGNGGAASFSISGAAAVGNSLSATVQQSDPDGNGIFAYNWQTSTDGTSWSSVGSNSPSYTVRDADEGRQLRLEVRYSDLKGFAETVFRPAGTVPLMPTLAISAASTALKEGNIGSTPYAFTISRSGDLSGESRVSWAVEGNGANPATALDFAGAKIPNGTAVFAAGQQTVSLNINVLSDAMVEPDEGFSITLLNPSGARLSSTASSAMMQILNDDQPSATYAFVATPETVYEGGLLHIGVTTTNVEAGRLLYWQLSGSGITASDFNDGLLSGSTVIGADGRASFTKAIAADAVVDPDEGLRVSFTSNAARTEPVGSSLALTIKEPTVGVVTDGNDIITGTTAAERISGVPTGSSSRGRGSLDRLTGGGGEDIFLLGDAQGLFYNDGTTGLGTTDLALISDFTAGDKIQLFGNSTAYRLISGRHGGNPGVRIDALATSPGDTPEAIGFVQGATLAALNLTNPNQFLFL